MKKRVSFLLFLLCFTGATAWAQSCSDIFSDTQFQPKSGISSTFYKLDECKISDPTAMTIMPGYSFDASGKLHSGTYAVSAKGAQFQIKAGDWNANTLVSLFLSELSTQGGKNKYSITLKGTVHKKPGCTPTSEGHRCNIALKIGNQNKTKEFTGSQFTQTPSPFTWTEEFSAKTADLGIVLCSDHSSDCAIVTLQSIVVKGCVEPRIASENGNKVCAGEMNTLTAKGVTATTYQWEVSYDNKTTWKALEGNEKSIEVEVTQEAYYRVTAGKTTLTSDLIRPVVCCSVAGTRTDVLVESFNLTGNRGQLTTGTTTYTYKAGGKIDEGEYAVVKSAKEGGYWTDEPVRQGHTGGANDGFMLVNCAKEPGIFFTYTVSDASLCSNTMYDFSAWITNVDNVAGHAPVNAGFKVTGYPSGKVLVDTETGNLPSGTDWIEKGESFNSGNDTRFEVTIRNNYKGDPEETKVVGNDIGIDDIRFSACSPEIRIYSDNEFKENVIVCEDGQVADVTLEALAVYDLTDFFETPYYQFQIQEGGVWKNVYASETEQHATTNAKITIQVDPVKYLDGLSYRVWVGASQAAVDASAKNGKPGTGCGALTAASEPITIQYYCDCTPSAAPEVENYNECPCPDAEGTKELASLVTANKDKLTWYASETATEALTETTFDCKTVTPTPITYYVTNTQPKEGITEYCESERVPVTVNVKDAVKYTLDKTEMKECLGEGVDLTFNVTGLQPADATVSWTDEEGTVTEGATFTLEKKAGSGILTLNVVDPNNTTCPMTEQVSYTLANPVSFNFTAPTMVCLADPQAVFTLQLDAQTTLTPYAIFKDGVELDKGEIPANTDNFVYTDPQVATTEGKVAYQITLGAEGCQSSKECTIQVADEVDLPIISSAQDNKVCTGDQLDYIEIQYTLQTGESITWTANGEVLPETGVRIENLKLTETTTFEAILNGGICAGNGSITITLIPPVEVKIDPVFEICLGESVQLTPSGADTYEWVPATGLDDPTSATPMASPTVNTEYTIRAYVGECYGEATTEVKVNPLPVINAIDEEGGTAIVQVSDGTAPYQYSLDNVNFDLSPIFSNLVTGHYEVYIIDEKGCKTEGAFEIEPAPLKPALYFTPDGKGDPATEVWTIQNLDTYPSWIVEIYDRNGRRIYRQQVSDSTGGEIFSWDGNYNGHPMPSDDYWYIITLGREGKQFAGHFTLKR